MRLKLESAFIATSIFMASTIYAQIPKVQVTFEIVPETPFADKFGAACTQIQEEGLAILIDSLNHYLPFFEFTKDVTVNKFSIKLDATAGTTNSKSYILNLSFRTPSFASRSENCNFLTANSFKLQTDVPTVLISLRKAWSDYLINSYNLVLVNKMFKELPIVLSSAEYYYGSGNPYELIIPYTKKGISLSERNSKFMVIVKDANATTQSIQTELRYTGDVLPSMNKPKPMMGCMRIGLNQVNFKPKTGEVYFLNYDRLVGDSGIKKGLIN